MNFLDLHSLGRNVLVLREIVSSMGFPGPPEGVPLRGRGFAAIFCSYMAWGCGVEWLFVIAGSIVHSFVFPLFPNSRVSC